VGRSLRHSLYQIKRRILIPIIGKYLSNTFVAYDIVKYVDGKLSAVAL